jgi:hypothetical protein
MDPNTEKACAVWHRGERWLSVEKSPSSAPPGHLLPVRTGRREKCFPSPRGTGERVVRSTG